MWWPGALEVFIGQPAHNLRLALADLLDMLVGPSGKGQPMEDLIISIHSNCGPVEKSQTLAAACIDQGCRVLVIRGQGYLEARLEPRVVSTSIQHRGVLI
ncbi:unnamed protein product [Calypogeia fissa]